MSILLACFPCFLLIIYHYLVIVTFIRNLLICNKKEVKMSVKNHLKKMSNDINESLKNISVQDITWKQLNDICKIVHFILNQSDNICLKSLLLYPDNESH